MLNPQVLLITEVGFESFHATAIQHLTQLRELAVSPPAHTVVPVEYARLTNLEILDLRNGHLAIVRHDTLDAIRESNISTLSFRKMDNDQQQLEVCPSYGTHPYSLCVCVPLHVCIYIIKEKP